MVDGLPYGRQFIDDDDVAAVVKQLRSDWLTQGPVVGEFEAALAKLTGAKYVVAVSSGTAALHLAALALGVGPGDLGVTSDVTFVASANAIRYAGGVPILVDVEPTTALINLDLLGDRLEQLTRDGKQPKVIIPVAFAGTLPDMERLRTLATKHGARVIEDAAHALGGTRECAGGKTFAAGDCQFADASILSFHPVKHITTGEGGAITTNDENIYQSLLMLRTHGITKDAARLTVNDGPWYYEQQALGFNYRLTDLQCALGLSQARKFPDFLHRRRALASMYDRALDTLATELCPLHVPAGVTSAYHLYVVRMQLRSNESLASLAERRRRLFLHLREHKIFAQVHYIPVHRQPDFRAHGLGEGAFPGAEAYYAGCISLPMFPAMSDDDVSHVVEVLATGLRQ